MMSQFADSLQMNISRFLERLQTSAPVTWLSLHLEDLLMQRLRRGPVPKHLAFVMDGNRRFAKKKGISIARGHMVGVEVLKKNLELCYMCGIHAVTIYIFSIENFKRPKSQVKSLMELLKLYFCSISERGGLLDRYGVTMRVLGRLELLEPDLLSTIQRTTDLTRDYGDKILNVCVSYTSRDEITGAIRQTIADCKIPVGTDKSRNDLLRDSSIKTSHLFCSAPSLYDSLDEHTVNVGQPMIIYPQNITSEMLADHIFTAHDPPLDLLIRTSGAHRLSDYLLWQCHQETHILFVETLWPDFKLWQFYSAIRKWQRGKQRLNKENRKMRPLGQSFHAVLDRIPPIVDHCYSNPESIQMDTKGLRRLPEHMSVILSLRKEHDALERLMDQVADLAAWSARTGIPTLSVYEKNGILKSYIPTLHRYVTSKLFSYYRSPLEPPVVSIVVPHHGIYNPLPAQSESKISNSTSMHLLLLSASDGRESLVDLTKSLAEMSQRGQLSLNDINIELIDAKINEIFSQPSQPIPALADIDYSSSHSNSACTNLTEPSPSRSVKSEPDFLFIDGPCIKLEGYPPWQIRLTEIFCTGKNHRGTKGRDKALTYKTFLRGLCQYAGAEMRFGR